MLEAACGHASTRAAVHRLGGLQVRSFFLSLSLGGEATQFLHSFYIFLDLIFLLMVL